MSFRAKVVAPNEPMILLTLALLLLVSGSTLVVVGSEADQPPKNKPLVVRVSQDRDTSLYTIPIKNGAPLVVDLAGPLVWSTCPPSSTHSTVACQSSTCRTANKPQHRPRRCSGYVDPGVFWASREEQPSRRSGCACATHPFNPVTGECSTGDLTTFAMSANATNGTAPLAQQPESFTAVGSCAPDRLLRGGSLSLPAGAAGVAGFSRSPLSLPSQLSAQREFGNTFALCMPGFALFGNTSIHLRRDLASETPYFLPVRTCELVGHPRNGGYYLPVKKIRVGWDEAFQQAEVSLPTGALDLDVSTGRGGVVLSTVTRYMTMRSDVYSAFIKVYDTVMRGVKRVPAVWPFELCYDLASLPPVGRNGMDVVVPGILLDLDLAGATDSRPWYLHTESYLVFVQGSSPRSGVGCAGVVEMGRAAAGAVEDQPAVVLGTMQLQDRLLVFDLDKGVLKFSDVIREAIPVAVCEDSFRDVAF